MPRKPPTSRVSRRIRHWKLRNPVGSPRRFGGYVIPTKLEKLRKLVVGSGLPKHVNHQSLSNPPNKGPRNWENSTARAGCTWQISVTVRHSSRIYVIFSLWTSVGVLLLVDVSAGTTTAASLVQRQHKLLLPWHGQIGTIWIACGQFQWNNTIHQQTEVENTTSKSHLAAKRHIKTGQDSRSLKKFSLVVSAVRGCHCRMSSGTASVPCFASTFL